ncbi:MAG: phenylalanine--tRNA ligase subunit beta [Clostridia bacterium]
MKLPLKWLREYVDFNVSVDEFIERMMWRGFELGALIDELPDVKNIVVGKILDIMKHENADKLRVCIVNVGSRTVQIVTNAQNVSVGDFVPVALAPAYISGGVKIEETVMRGVESGGMFCSYREIGITNVEYPGCEYDGVLIFKDEFTPGTDIKDALDLNSVIFDFDITPNRADCQSIIGICREAAAALGQPFVEPIIKPVLGVGQDFAKVTVLNSELCPRYCARTVRDIKIEPSPLWMQKKLRMVGLRPINNIVDITNYVLIEYGHPMHAFDLSCIKNAHIVVRNAMSGEMVTTLDAKERKLNENMLVIADTQRAVGLAGVMGGENSEIKPSTKEVLFESAAFKSDNIRKTTRELRHTTDSAQRFMRGVETVNAKLALDRAIELVDELNAGVVIGNGIDVCEKDLSPRVITVDYDHINAILGMDFKPEKIAELLGTINIEAKIVNCALNITVPHYRTDIMSDIEADWDIAEEIARLYGYYLLTPTLMYGDTFCGSLSPEMRDEDLLKDIMVTQGAYEMYNYNFISPSMLAQLSFKEGDERLKAVKILNPFGTDQSIMRTTLIPPILNTLSLNIKHKTNHDRFFEVGNVHFDNPDLPVEKKHLGIAFMGENEDFFTLKGAIETVLDIFGLVDYYFVETDSDCFKPGQRAKLMMLGDVLGELGAVHPDVLKAYDVAKNVVIAEIDVEKMLIYKRDRITYEPIPKYPMVPRDIAVVVDEDIKSDKIMETIKQSEIDILLGEIRLFDVYRGKGIPDGKKSMAYSFLLYHKERTLTDKDIKDAMDIIVKALKKNVGAELR